MPKCCICKTKFKPVFNTTEPTCGDKNCQYQFAIKTVEKNRKKAARIEQIKWRKEKAVLIEKTKSKSDYEKELQKLVNLICRLIDTYCVCISCGNFCKKPQGGHYFSVGSNPQIRYNLFNIWQQCYRCNCELSGNLLDYQLGLKNTIGLLAYDEMEQGLKMVKALHLSIPELKDKISIARLLVKEFEAAEKMGVVLPRNAAERLEMREYVNKRIGIYE